LNIESVIVLLLSQSAGGKPFLPPALTIAQYHTCTSSEMEQLVCHDTLPVSSAQKKIAYSEITGKAL